MQSFFSVKLSLIHFNKLYVNTKLKTTQKVEMEWHFLKISLYYKCSNKLWLIKLFEFSFFNSNPILSFQNNMSLCFCHVRVR